jgi:hypothetical protein
MKTLLAILLSATLLVGCKAPENLPLSGGVQTVLLTPTGELARLPRQPLTVKEPDNSEQYIVTDENGLAAFPLKGPETEYLLLTDVTAWRGYAQVVVYVVFSWVENRLVAVEVRQ